jgi:hypothetical protein
MATGGQHTLTPQGLIWKLPYDQGREHHWNAWQVVAGNGYLIFGVLLLGVAALQVLRTAPRQGDASGVPARTDTLEGSSVRSGGRTP